MIASDVPVQLKSCQIQWIWRKNSKALLPLNIRKCFEIISNKFVSNVYGSSSVCFVRNGMWLNWSLYRLSTHSAIAVQHIFFIYFFFFHFCWIPTIKWNVTLHRIELNHLANKHIDDHSNKYHNTFVCYAHNPVRPSRSEKSFFFLISSD